jgi:rhodanese-related sulfurtransferase
MKATDFFAARLAFQTDVSDVHAALETGGFTLVDTRSRAAWNQGHIAGAVHLPTAGISAKAHEVIDPEKAVVTYCWGPGCNGATRAALRFAEAGYDVKEMIGGVEYWIREGFGVRTENGVVVSATDPLTATCGC